MKALNCLLVPSVALLALVLQPAPETRLGISFIGDARALVGVPWSPASVAGVARRTTRRAAVYSGSVATSTTAQQQAIAEQQAAVAQQQAAVAEQQAAVAQQQAAVSAQQTGTPPIGSTVATLPKGCVSAPKDKVQYFNCAGTYYRAAFQGNNLVYVAVTQP